MNGIGPEIFGSTITKQRALRLLDALGTKYEKFEKLQKNLKECKQEINNSTEEVAQISQTIFTKIDKLLLLGEKIDSAVKDRENLSLAFNRKTTVSNGFVPGGNEIMRKINPHAENISESTTAPSEEPASKKRKPDQTSETPPSAPLVSPISGADLFSTPPREAPAGITGQTLNSGWEVLEKIFRKNRKDLNWNIDERIFDEATE